MAEHTGNALDSSSVDDPWLKSALHDVPLPAGLAERLKSGIKSQLPQTDSVHSASAVESTTQSADAGWLRRSFIVLALAAGISGFAFLANRWTRLAEPRWLAGQCDAILAQLEKDNLAAWERVDQAAPKLPPAVTSQFTRIGFIAQRPLAAISPEMHGMIYRLDAGDGRGIVLLKFERLPAVRGLTSRFEILPTPSGGWSLAAMTIGNETYVLAGACTEQQLFGYVRRLALT